MIYRNGGTAGTTALTGNINRRSGLVSLLPYMDAANFVQQLDAGDPTKDTADSSGGTGAVRPHRNRPHPVECLRPAIFLSAMSQRRWRRGPHGHRSQQLCDVHGGLADQHELGRECVRPVRQPDLPAHAGRDGWHQQYHRIRREGHWHVRPRHEAQRPFSGIHVDERGLTGAGNRPTAALRHSQFPPEGCTGSSPMLKVGSASGGLKDAPKARASARCWLRTVPRAPRAPIQTSVRRIRSRRQGAFTPVESMHSSRMAPSALSARTSTRAISPIRLSAMSRAFPVPMASGFTRIARQRRDDWRVLNDACPVQAVWPNLWNTMGPWTAASMGPSSLQDCD